MPRILAIAECPDIAKADEATVKIFGRFIYDCMRLERIEKLGQKSAFAGSAIVTDFAGSDGNKTEALMRAAQDLGAALESRNNDKAGAPTLNSSLVVDTGFAAAIEKLQKAKREEGNYIVAFTCTDAGAKAARAAGASEIIDFRELMGDLEPRGMGIIEEQIRGVAGRGSPQWWKPGNSTVCAPQ